jgi:hypothetical protein
METYVTFSHPLLDAPEMKCGDCHTTRGQHPTTTCRCRCGPECWVKHVGCANRASFVALPFAMYSASMVDVATVGSSFEPHLITLPAMVNTLPPVLRRLSGFRRKVRVSIALQPRICWSVNDATLRRLLQTLQHTLDAHPVLLARLRDESCQYTHSRSHARSRASSQVEEHAYRLCIAPCVLHQVVTVLAEHLCQRWIC